MPLELNGLLGGKKDAQKLTAFEAYVAGVWRRTLGLGEGTVVNPGDSFLLMGGNSLGMVQLAAAFRAELQVGAGKLKISQLLSALTLQEMAAVVQGVVGVVYEQRLRSGVQHRRHRRGGLHRNETARI